MLNSSFSVPYCLMLVRTVLRNGYLYEYNPLTQKTFRIQEEFTEVAFVATQRYQVTLLTRNSKLNTSLWIC